MDNRTFYPKRETLGFIQPTWSDERLKNEPMLFSADLHFAVNCGGPLTHQFLIAAGLSNKLDDRWVIDSRVHMLMPDWYPCIPGWHHDDIPRDRPDGQPDYDTTAYESEHISAIVDMGTGSLTEYIDQDVCLETPAPGKVVYREWDAALRAVRPRTVSAKNLEVIKFSCYDFHRGMPATAHGWRWFIRASRNTKRQVLNEIRTQVQVYMPVLTAGW